MNVYIIGDGASASDEFPTFQTRPIDKHLKVVNFDFVSETPGQFETSLFTATYPCTLLGLRWVHTTMSEESAVGGMFHWVIAVVPDGQSASTIDPTDGGDLYQPEQNVLAFGLVRFTQRDHAGPHAFVLEGAVKTGRKLKVGDSLVFELLGSDFGLNIDDTNWDSAIQFFTRS